MHPSVCTHACVCLWTPYWLAHSVTGQQHPLQLFIPLYKFTAHSPTPLCLPQGWDTSQWGILDLALPAKTTTLMISLKGLATWWYLVTQCSLSFFLYHWQPVSALPHMRFLYDKLASCSLIIIIMSAFLERLSMWNMLNCAEQVQIQKYKTHMHIKTLKMVGVQIIMLKHPTKHKKEYP